MDQAVKTPWGAVVALLLALVAAPAHATIISYDESVDGDLSPDTTGPLFTLDMAGTHTWTGSTVWNVGASGIFDADNFRIALGNGLQLVATNSTVSGISVSGWSRVDAQYAIFEGEGFGTAVFREHTELLSLSVSNPLDLLPLGVGNYTVRAPVGGVGFCQGSCNASWDWSITMTVAGAIGVPEPAPLALLGVVLAALGLGPRRRAAP